MARLLSVTVLAVSSLLFVGCDLDIGEFGQFVDLSTSDEPAEKAVAEATEQVDDIQRANRLVETSLKTGDIASLDEAVKLRSDDPDTALLRDLATFVQDQPTTATLSRTLPQYIAAEAALNPGADDVRLSKNVQRRRAQTYFRFLTEYKGPRSDDAFEVIRKLYCANPDFLSELLADSSPC